MSRFPAALLLCLLGVAVIANGCGPSARSKKPQVVESQRPEYKRKLRAAKEIPVPPWQLWDNSAMGSPELAAAEAALEKGDLEQALFFYRDAMERASSVRVLEEAQLRRFGTWLKMGRSNEVLQGISKYLASQNLGVKDVGERYALLVAYSYHHQRDTDQTLAWLTTAYRATNGQGSYSLRAKQALEQLLQELPPAAFNEFQQRWKADQVAGPLFTKERIRRAQGGRIGGSEQPNWFAASTYRRAFPPDVPDSALAKLNAGQDGLEVVQTVGVDEQVSLPRAGARAIGVLLPLSGRFAEHALKVKEGISLAAESGPGAPVKVIVADTKGDAVIAEQEYLRLAQQEGVSVVLGPLLVKEAEQVALRSREVGTPFITFTKRSGVPELGSAVFRLGATLEDQVIELLSYASSELGVREFAAIYPENSSGQEFEAIFRGAIRSLGLEITGTHGYYQGDESSAEAAVAEASLRRPQAIFIPDSLEGAFQVLDKLQTSELTDALLLGPAQWNDPVAIRGYGQLLDGAVFVTPFFAASRAPGVSTFIADYMKRYQHSPELLAAQAYDATVVALRSLEGGQNTDQTLIDRLSNVDAVQGVTGKLSVQRDGEIRRRMTVLRLYKGEVIEVMTGGVATGFFPDGQTKTSKEQERVGFGSRS